MNQKVLSKLKELDLDTQRLFVDLIYEVRDKVVPIEIALPSTASPISRAQQGERVRIRRDLMCIAQDLEV